MDRLTKVGKDGYVDRVNYEDLKEKGLLIELPCKVGDTVYDLQKMRNRIQPLVITSIQIEKNGIFFSWELVGVGIYHNVSGFEASQIGKTVFLTQSEAERALAERKKNENIKNT